VLFTQKSRPLGVENGSMGEVLWVDPETKQIGVQLDRGSWVRVPLEEYAHVHLGYAVTTHKGQGATVERAFILAGGPLGSREISYVQASRSRGATQIFVDRAEAGERLTQLVRTMSTSRQKEMAHSLRMRGERGLEPDHAQGPRLEL
jgi:ATP-dependent exoDNAse (exonuclease V) alpha subunit